MERFFDPIAEAFFADENLEYDQRVGNAILAAAKYAPISLGKNILPTACAKMDDGIASFKFSDGIRGEFDSVEALVKKFPQEEELIREYARKLKAYADISNVCYSSEAIDRLSAGWGGWWAGHGNPDFGKIVNEGTDAIRKKISECRVKNPEKSYFYDGCECAMQALEVLGERFYLLAEKEEKNAVSELDKKRFARVKQAFSVIPKKPAQDFTAACCAFWLTFTFDGCDSPGRFDQFMIRAYQNTNDKEEIADVLDRLWECFYEKRSWNLCLSGSDENWQDETNQLTFDILAIAAKKKYNTPNITLRVHRNTPEALWQAATETLATGIGMPAIYNDEVVCPALERLDILPKDSHDYCLNGCNQLEIMGKSHMGLEDGEIYFANLVDYALHDGFDTVRKVQAGIKTGDPCKFKTYEEFERAFYQQMEYAVLQICLASNAGQLGRGLYSPNPFRSCLIEGCLEKGVDYRNGGPLYNSGQILGEAIADAGDSLWAVKKLVFDEKKYTMAELIKALDDDFIGHEQLYYDFSHCEKFGNNFAQVDMITSKFINRCFELFNRTKTYRGGVFAGGCSPYNRAANVGRALGTLPSGHKKGDPIIADSIGAHPGCDVNGPTALIHSVLNFNQVLCGSGFVLQAKFDKKLFNTKKGKQSFIALVKTYFACGGQQYTATVVSPEDLLDAKINPQNHRDLIVRVGGYSDYFINLDEGLQDNIIARTNVDV